MSDLNINETLLVAFARLETKMDAMMKQLEDLSKTSDQHWKRINEIETKLALIEQRQGEPVVKGKPWGVILAVGVSVSTFVIMVLDRFYVNQ